MSRPPSQSASHRAILFALLFLLVIVAYGVSRVTIADTDLGKSPPRSAALTVDEATYYDFVAPRLDRLVVEVDRVTEMVDGRSRNVLALKVSADRIEALTGEIVEFGEHDGVPILFGDVHRRIVEGTGTATYAIDEARSALRNFNFSAMSMLVRQFKDAAHALHVAQEELVSIAGSDSA